MTRRLISSGSPFEATIGYSRAVVQGDFCFVSGCTGYDPDTRIMPDSAADQARNAFRVIERALAEAGFEMADIVRVVYYATDMAWWNEAMPVFAETLGDIRPAATGLIVGLVAPEMKLEIEVTAMRRG
ncbi:RidA family protein [Sphingomonas sp. LaA6.9]|uniref:RidA family protein n=1 Tax=Sphingomonas sp. LaA6.9 TaxID=2919914 RepID=UPI001F503557|nr:RidA family protein [Sphingomonas sp. LaA6.9]MCJ8158229.1 RidA family protein [Sphingomonas sp. LaA6.9]